MVNHTTEKLTIVEVFHLPALTQPQTVRAVHRIQMHNTEVLKMSFIENKDSTVDSTVEWSEDPGWSTGPELDLERKTELERW